MLCRCDHDCGGGGHFGVDGDLLRRQAPGACTSFPCRRCAGGSGGDHHRFCPWAYVGFDSIPQLAGEFNFSPRKALGLLLWGITVATVIYMAMMLATSIAVGTHLDAFEGEAWPPAAAISEVMGPADLVLMVVAVSAGVLTGLNGFYTAASRVLFTLGRANLDPRRLGELKGQGRTPRNAILLMCAVCSVTPWFGRAALTWVVDMSSTGITAAYFYACFCAWCRFRVDGTASPRSWYWGIQSRTLFTMLPS